MWPIRAGRGDTPRVIAIVAEGGGAAGGKTRALTGVLANGGKCG
jgi:hypothetical protein